MLFRFLLSAFWLICTCLVSQSVCAAGPSSGQWYDRTHSGHGLDLNRVSGTLFGTFYTYTSDGSAQWLWLQTQDSAAPSGTLTRFNKLLTAPPEATVIGSFSLTPVNSCSDGIARPGVMSLLEFRFSVPQGSQIWCLEPLLPAATVAESALDGHWYMPQTTGDPDFGWGLVTHYFPGSSGTQSFQAFYFYDAAGNPRWAVANAAISGFAQSLDFFTLTTTCFACPTSKLSEQPVGRAELTLRTPQANAAGANQLQISLRFDANSNFARSGELALLSTPRAVAQVRATAQGLVRGARVETGPGGDTGLGGAAVERFSNIPFAAPPVAALRFRAPQKADLRAQTYGAQSIGPGCLQPAAQSLFTSSPATQSEDCLQLNIWQPAVSESAELLPVMLWIHGGGLTIGSATDQISSRLVYDGSAFAKKGVVLVSINYRLGAFGFMAPRAMVGEALDQPAAGNYGLLDQIAALKWVRDNISQFGGDPNLVTIFGESAGGVSACALLAVPAARGLFARAISQSGNCLRAPNSNEAALSQGDRIAANAGCANIANQRGCLRALSAPALLAASNAVVNLTGTVVGETYGLNLDGFMLTESPAAAIAGGRGAPVPYMLGVNDDESTSTNPASGLPGTAEGYQALVRSQFPTIAGLVLAQYPVENYPTPQRAYQDIVDDLRFTCANRRAAADHAAFGNRVYHYALTQILPDAQLAPLESFHGIDIPFLFERAIASSNEVNMRVKMQNAWINFARDGDPGNALGYVWPRYEMTRQGAELNSMAVAPINDYRKSYCEFWARYVVL